MPDIYRQTTMADAALTIFAIIVIIVIAWCLYSFIHAIILFVFSWAKEENKKKWRNSIRFMIIGLLLTVVLLVAFPFILKWMNVDLWEDYSAKKVFSKAGELLQKVVLLKDIVKESQQDNQFRWNLYYPSAGAPSSTTSQPSGNYDL
jgi:formate hydrogenlyase subunit 3/multisubunit Na+/H+ antiporter MnhD subunit